MIHFYRGEAECSIMNISCYIQAESSMKAENKLISYYDEKSSIHGELLSIHIEKIDASEYYGTMKYNNGIHL